MPIDWVNQASLGLMVHEPKTYPNFDAGEAMDVVTRLEEFRSEVGQMIFEWRQRLAEMVPAGEVVDLGRIEAVSIAKFRDRYDHRRIQEAVVRHACVDPDTGEICDDPMEAARRTAELMKDVYLAPSTKPKLGALQRIGFETKFHAMKTHEETGRTVLKRVK